MFNIYKLKTIEFNGVRIYLKSTTMLELGILDGKFIIASFGLKKTFAEIETYNNLEENEIGFTQEALERLCLPLDIKIQMRVRSNELVIGPCIGILISKKSCSITSEKLKKFLKYTILYDEIAGAILIFNAEKIDYNNKSVEAYCYNPYTNNFIFGRYPFPSVVYRRTGLSNNQKKKIKLLISNNIFNSHFFNKWDLYQWLSKSYYVKDNIPDTRLYSQYSDINDMLRKYGSIFVKPVSGMQGKKIVKVSLKDEALMCEYKQDNTNKKESFYGNTGKTFLYEFLKNDRYLIQQPIELLQYNKSVIDFRVIMQKGLSGKWGCNGIIGRLGNSESIVSNISSGGRALEVDKLLREMYLSDETQIFIFKEKIKAFAFKVCDALSEQPVNLGTLGLDIGIDRYGKPWIIEVNNRDPDPTIALDAGNKHLYYKLISYPLLYAEFLAGFGN